MAKNPFSLERKTAIVTGGGTGIGKSIAIEFARAGADVALCSRKLEHLEPVAKAIRDIGKRTFAVAVDVRQEDQVKAVVERAVSEWGRLDVMVNNAGASFRAKPEDISVNGWNTVVGINLTGAFLGCKWAGRQMMAQKTGGVIINISSIAAVCSVGIVAYKTSKAAVNAFTQSLAIGNGEFNIRANVIMPGLMNTPMAIEGYVAAGRNREVLIAQRDSQVPLGKTMGSGWDVANAALFLASDEARFISGVCLPVDGGQSARIG